MHYRIEVVSADFPYPHHQFKIMLLVFFDIVRLDRDERVAARPALFVHKSQRVAEFMHDYEQAVPIVNVQLLPAG